VQIIFKLLGNIQANIALEIWALVHGVDLEKPLPWDFSKTSIVGNQHRCRRQRWNVMRFPKGWVHGCILPQRNHAISITIDLNAAHALACAGTRKTVGHENRMRGTSQ